MRNTIVTQDLAEITAEDLPWERLRNARVLVTGASGILASYVVETLLYLNETRHMGIHILAVQRDLKKAQRRFAHDVSHALTLLQQDVRAPLSIDGTLDYIIHAAGQASPKFYGSDPIGTIEGHILGTRNVLVLAREKGVKGMLYFSSCDSYGEHFTEDAPPCLAENYIGRIDPLSDRSCYPMGKAAAEALCHAYTCGAKLPVKIVRIAHTYAPLMPLDDGRVFTDFIGNALRGEDIALNSDGSAERPMLYIADAVRAYFRVLFLGESGEAYNVAAQKNTSIRELAELIAITAPNGHLHVTIKAEKRPGYLQAPAKRIKISTDKLRALGYVEHHTLAEGMQRVFASYTELSGGKNDSMVKSV